MTMHMHVAYMQECMPKWRLEVDIRWLLSLKLSTLFFLRQVLLLNLKLAISARVAGQQDQRVCLSRPSSSGATDMLHSHYLAFQI